MLAHDGKCWDIDGMLLAYAGERIFSALNEWEMDGCCWETDGFQKLENQCCNKQIQKAFIWMAFHWHKKKNYVLLWELSGAMSFTCWFTNFFQSYRWHYTGTS